MIRLFARSCLPLTVCALLVLAVGAEDGHAIEGGRSWYTYTKGTNCADKKQVDPINVVFYGRDATAGRTDAFVDKYMGWGDATDSGTQGFLTPRCRLAAHQRANGSTDETRHHVRLRQLDKKRGARRLFSAGDAHYEDHVGSIANPFTGCGRGKHAVKKGAVDRKPEDRGANGSGFDQGRELMADRWGARGRRVTKPFKGNTHSEQCDGDFAGSDGRVAYMTIPDRR